MTKKSFWQFVSLPQIGHFLKLLEYTAALQSYAMCDDSHNTGKYVRTQGFSKEAFFDDKS